MDIKNCFEKIYGKAPDGACFAPGRVNLIGEHTDYNGGHVFPCAVQMGVYCSASRRADRNLRFYSLNFPDVGEVSCGLDELKPTGTWADYPISVIRAFAAFGYSLDNGADFCFYGDLPDGAGLSSSAAIEVVTGTMLRELYSIPVTSQEVALIGQFAENRFIGLKCGIMDQFASAMGRRNSAVLLDSDTLEYEYAPLGDASLVIVNSGVKHSLASSAYNDRRRECETACAELGAPSLCALSPEEFEAKKHLIKNDVCLRRARHAVYENQRTLEAVRALRQGELSAFGKLMNASHISLRDDYEVSCGELDFLAETAWSLPYTLGARMTGGGFGGCTINLIEQGSEQEFIEAVQSAYQKRFGKAAPAYRVCAGDGARRID